MSRRGFTLVEMLMALLILSVVGSAMIATLITATRIFEDGERRRAAADELVAVWSLIEADLARAVPPQQGGVFVATPHPLGDASADPLGLHEIGWTVVNPDPADAIVDPYEFVVYHVDHTATDTEGRRTYPLYRRLYESRTSYQAALGTLGRHAEVADNGAVTYVAGTSLITEGCVAFTVQLAGTNTTTAGELLARPSDDYWTTMAVLDASGALLASPMASEPTVGLPPWDSSQLIDTANPSLGTMRYPDALRVVLSLDPARLPQRGVVTVDDGTANLRVAGIRSWPSTPGNVVRIGDELVGFHGAIGGLLRVNSVPGHGPLADPTAASPSGRGVYGSTTPSGGHPTGTEVRLGITTAITRTLSR